MRTVYTCGHSTRPFAELVSLLQNNGVTLLADVRAVPRSRFHPQYNRGFLEKNLPMRYVWMGDRLGGKNSKEITAEEFDAGIAELLRLADRNAVCILCSERLPTPSKYRPEGCHRWAVITPALEAKGASVIHLL